MNIDSYVKSLKKIILPLEQEHMLARRIKKSNDLAAYTKLITSNLRYVIKVAYKYKGYIDDKAITFADLVQAGNVGITIAAKKYDAKYGTRFVSYATYWIEAYIRNFIITQNCQIKLITQRHDRGLFFKTSKINKLMHGNLTRKQEKKLRKELKFTSKQILEFNEKWNVKQAMRSMNQPIRTNNGGDALYIEIPTDVSLSQSSLLENKMVVDKIKGLLESGFSKLNDKEKYVIQQRYLTGNPKTYDSIGKLDSFKVTREWIRQIEMSAIKKLKKAILENNNEFVQEYYAKD